MSDFQLKNINHSEIIELLDGLAIDPKNKEEFGEVPTPTSLINDMLNRLPQSVWKDPNKTWLDPATGIGSFQLLVYDRLMRGLESWQPISEKRHDHIIRNMLFLCEINPTSVKQAKKYFGQNSNIIKGDFLKHDFSTTKFDIILGNPPFNEGQNIEDISKRGSGNQIWIDFVEKSLDLLSPSGLLLFIHPPGWRKPTTESSRTHGLFKKMAHDNQIEYLEIYDKADGLKLFGVQTRYDWYLLSNHKCNKKTIIKDDSGKEQKLDLRKWQFLPNGDYSLIKRMLAGLKDNHVNILFSRTQFGTDSSWTNEKESTKFQYPLVHSTPIGEEPRLYWTSTKEPPIKGELVPMFGQKKAIFGEAGINKNIVLDNEGKYGMTQGAMAIPFSSKKEGIQIKQTLESDEFARIIEAMSFGNFRIDWRIFLFMKRDFYKRLNKRLITQKNRVNKKKYTVKYNN